LATLNCSEIAADISGQRGGGNGGPVGVGDLPADLTLLIQSGPEWRNGLGARLIVRPMLPRRFGADNM